MLQRVEGGAFESLYSLLSKFQLRKKPVSEFELEQELNRYLGTNAYYVVSQLRHGSRDRFDLIVRMGTKSFCIELKCFADRSCTPQLDRYANSVDGLILVCWQASKSLQQVFEIQKPYAKIPIAIVQIRANSDFT